MALPKNFEIVIDEDGNFSIEVNGCSGESCTNLTEALTRNLGVVESQDLKAEYYVQERPDYIDQGTEE